MFVPFFFKRLGLIVLFVNTCLPMAPGSEASSSQPDSLLFESEGKLYRRGPLFRVKKEYMEKALNVLDAQEMLFKESAALKEYLKSRDYEESDVKECIEKYIAENVHALCKVRKGMSFPMLLEFLIETYKADKDVRNLKNLWLIAERPSQQEKLYLAVESLEHEIAYGKNKYGACPE